MHQQQLEEIRKLSLVDLLRETKKSVDKERQATILVLQYLFVCDEKKLYAEFGFESLFMFAVKD
jgi:hypothetical protein